MTLPGILLMVVGVLLIAIGLFLLFRSLTSERAEVKGAGFELNVPLSIMFVLIGAGLSVAPLYLSGRNVAASPPATTSPATTPAATTTSTRPPVVATTISPELLPNIFRQVGDGKAFVFKNNRGVLQDDYIDEVGCRRETRPLGLRLRWNMTGPGDPSGGWGVQWADPNVNGFDASSFTSLAITVKGASGGERFQVGLKDLNNREVKIESREKAVISSSVWRTLRIQLSEFTNVDTAQIANVNLGFNRNHGRGQVCVDEIAFIR